MYYVVVGASVFVCVCMEGFVRESCIYLLKLYWHPAVAVQGDGCKTPDKWAKLSTAKALKSHSLESQPGESTYGQRGAERWDWGLGEPETTLMKAKPRP